MFLIFLLLNFVSSALFTGFEVVRTVTILGLSVEISPFLFGEVVGSSEVFVSGLVDIPVSIDSALLDWLVINQEHNPILCHL